MLTPFIRQRMNMQNKANQVLKVIDHNECVYEHSTSAYSFIRHKMLNPLIRQRLNMVNKAYQVLKVID